MQSFMSELHPVCRCLPRIMSIVVYIGLSTSTFIKNLCATFALWSNFPMNPSLPSLVTLEIVLSVPAYYRLRQSPITVQSTLNLYMMSSGLESNVNAIPSFYIFAPYLFSSLKPKDSSCICKATIPTLLYPTLVLSSESRQLVLITPHYRSSTFLVAKFSTNHPCSRISFSLCQIMTFRA